MRILHATDLDGLCTVAWSAFAGDYLDGGPVRDLMAAAVSRCRYGEGAARAVEWLSDNGLPFMSQEVARMADRLDVTLVFRPVRSSMVGSLSDAFAQHVLRALAARDALRDSNAILAELPQVIDGVGHARAVFVSRLIATLVRPPARKTKRRVRMAAPTLGHEA